jgi:hypothetical protein
MTRRRALLALLVLGLILGLLALGSGSAATGPSIYSLRSRGLRVAFRYLEERGAEPTAWRQELAQLPNGPGTLVIAAPLQRRFGTDDADALDRWLSTGGDVVLLLSGRTPTPAAWLLLQALGVEVEQTEEHPPLRWDAWKSWSLREATLQPMAPWGSDPTPQMRAASHHPQLPAQGRVYLADDQGQPMLFEYPRRNGRVLVLTEGSALGNQWIGEPGNLALLERVGAWPQPLFIDEWHQGHSVTASTSAEVLGPFEALVAQVLLLYLVSVWTLSRRFGPKSPPSRERHGSAHRDLLALAALHQRSGHANQAGRLLLDLARGSLRPGQPDPLPAYFYGGERALLALARQVGDLQADRILQLDSAPTRPEPPRRGTT